tara:strand:- start:115 stop:366 length:252 start_codon:yes stop_codon:yes gene_type:complete
MNKKLMRKKSELPGAVGVKVVKTKNQPKGDINYALRSFKKEMKASGRLQELRERRYFVPKSQRRRVQLERAKYFQWVEDQNNK